MLFRKNNSWDAQDLQTIVLINLEANHKYKWLVREAIQAAISHNQIEPEQ